MDHHGVITRENKILRRIGYQFWSNLTLWTKLFEGYICVPNSHNHFSKKNLTIIIKLAYIYRYDMYERTILTRLPSKTDLLTVNAVTPPLLSIVLLLRWWACGRRKANTRSDTNTGRSKSLGLSCSVSYSYQEMATGSELPPVMSWGGFSTRQTELAAEAVGKTSPRLLQRRRSSSMPPGSVAWRRPGSWLLPTAACWRAAPTRAARPRWACWMAPSIVDLLVNLWRLDVFCVVLKGGLLLAGRFILRLFGLCIRPRLGFLGHLQPALQMSPHLFF